MSDTSKVASAADRLWPRELAEDWDAPGFALHIPGGVERVLLSVDVTGAVVAEAAAKSCQMIISHHPFLMRGTQNINFDDLKGSVIQQAIHSGVSLFAAHTNADVVSRGVSATLAAAIGLEGQVPLVAGAESKIGHGRIGYLRTSITLKELAARLAELLPFTARGVLVSGDPDAQISTIALCGGAGDSFLDAAFDSGADVYITSDLRHHPALDAVSRPRTRPFACIDISHWAAESLWLPSAAEQLSELVPDVEFLISEVTTDPWVFSINRGEQ
jgi:dinuclear metal center YbgI/SA1388 family protein